MCIAGGAGGVSGSGGCSGGGGGGGGGGIIDKPFNFRYGWGFSVWGSVMV